MWLDVFTLSITAMLARPENLPLLQECMNRSWRGELDDKTTVEGFPVEEFHPGTYAGKRTATVGVDGTAVRTDKPFFF
jgi:hypothetical protein